MSILPEICPGSPLPPHRLAKDAALSTVDTSATDGALAGLSSVTASLNSPVGSLDRLPQWHVTTRSSVIGTTRPTTTTTTMTTMTTTMTTTTAARKSSPVIAPPLSTRPGGPLSASVSLPAGLEAVRPSLPPFPASLPPPLALAQTHPSPPRVPLAGAVRPQPRGYQRGVAVAAGGRTPLGVPTLPSLPRAVPVVGSVLSGTETDATPSTPVVSQPAGDTPEPTTDHKPARPKDSPRGRAPTTPTKPVPELPVTRPSPPRTHATPPPPPVVGVAAAEAAAKPLDGPLPHAGEAMSEARPGPPGVHVLDVSVVIHASDTAPNTTTVPAACLPLRPSLGKLQRKKHSAPTILVPLPAALPSLPPPPLFTDFPPVLWQVWRRYMPCRLNTIEALGGTAALPLLLTARTPLTAAGRVAQALLARLARDQESLAVRGEDDSHHSDDEDKDVDAAARPADWLNPLLSRALAAGRVDSNLSPRRPLYESELLSGSALAFAQTYYPKEIAMCLNFAYHLVRTLAHVRHHPAPYTNEKTTTTTTPHRPHQPHTPVERDPLARTMPYKSPLGQEDLVSAPGGSQPAVCPCGCANNNGILDDWGWEFHAHYYRAHHAFINHNHSPHERETEASMQCTSLAMLPLIAVELFAHLIASVTDACAAEEAHHTKKATVHRGRRRHHRRHHRASREADLVADLDNDDNDDDDDANDDAEDQFEVAMEQSLEGLGSMDDADSPPLGHLSPNWRRARGPTLLPSPPPLHLRRGAFRAFFTPERLVLVMAACVLLAWKQVDINAHPHFFFLNPRARRYLHRLRHRDLRTLTGTTSVCQPRALTTADPILAVTDKGVPSLVFANDALLAFRMDADMLPGALVEMEEYVVNKVGDSGAFGRLPLWLTVATEMIAASYDAEIAEVKKTHEKALAKLVAAARASRDCAKKDGNYDRNHANKDFKEKQLAVVAQYTKECAAVRQRFHAAADKVMVVSGKWLLVPAALEQAAAEAAAAAANEKADTVRAMTRRRLLYHQITQHHPLLGVALAVHIGAVPRAWALRFVAPAFARAQSAPAAPGTVPSHAPQGACEVDRHTYAQLNTLLDQVKDLLRVGEPQK